MDVRKRIDEILSEKKMSRRQLAIRAGIPPSSLQSAMQRDRPISLDMLCPIAYTLGVSVAYLTDGEIKLSQDFEEQEDLIARFGPPENVTSLQPSHDIWLNDMGYKENLILNELISHYKNLNTNGMNEASKRVEELTMIPKYKRTKTPLEAFEDAEKRNAPYTQEKQSEGHCGDSESK